MITVSILINGEPIYTRTAVNRLKELGVYVQDDGSRIMHNPDDGAVALAIKMLHTIEENPDELSMCDNCYSMTKTVRETCGKCRSKKRKQ